jgi:AraC-like DNA-binding protein
VGDSIYCIFFILFNPSLLDVYYFRNFLEEAAQKQVKVNTLITEVSGDFISEYEKINISIENYLNKHFGYLQIDFTVEKLAQEMKIPQRVISFAIKKVHGISVKDYINKMRIDYLIEQYTIDEKVRNYSFDYLAEMAGFGSRQTLYSCSQKFYNCPPKELFEKFYLKLKNEKY